MIKDFAVIDFSAASRLRSCCLYFDMSTFCQVSSSTSISFASQLLINQLPSFHVTKSPDLGILYDEIDNIQDLLVVLLDIIISKFYSFIYLFLFYIFITSILIYSSSFSYPLSRLGSSGYQYRKRISL